MKPKMKVGPITDLNQLREKGFERTPALWEDGMRSSGDKGSYEWWYTDAHMEDGSTIVAIFYTKPLQEINKSLTPQVEIAYSTADGKEYNRLYTFSPEEFSASKEKCEVKIGRNYFKGNLEEYEIHIEDDTTNDSFTLFISRQTETWRAGDGCFYYGDTGKYLGWFVAVPQGRIKAVISLDGITKTVNGSAYHDHNWGNVAMQEIINHWYWSRAEIGPYTVINSCICCPGEYDLAEWGCSVLAKDGKILSDNAENQAFFRSTPHVQPVTGKLVSDVIKFVNLDADNTGYELTLTKDHNILNDEKIKNKLVRAVAMYQGKNVGYHRMTGAAELKIFEKGCLKETQRNDAAVWEMMSFADPE